MIYTPREYQAIIDAYVRSHPRCNVFAGMGMGKTSSLLLAFETMRLFGEVTRLLVIAPKRVARDTWPDEVRKFKESFGHLTVAVAVGTPAERMAAITSGADITCINYDCLAWLESTGIWVWDMVVADESTRLKGLRVSMQVSKLGKEFVAGQGASRAKALSKLAFNGVKRWVNLTGSPAPNGIVDLWGQQFFIDRGRRLGSSFIAFSDRWFRPVPGADGYSRIEPLKHSQKEVEALLKDCCITVDSKDWFDVKDTIERIVYIKLPPKARAIYNRMEKELFAEIDGHEIEVFNAGSKSIKCLQIGSGFIYDEDGAAIPIHDEKIDALKSIVSEANGEPILVTYQFIPEKLAILKAFPRARTIDQIATADWNAGKHPMLVVHPASAGHGLNLQDGSRICVDFSTGWNLEYDEQVIERIGPVRQLQAGHDRSVFRYRIVAQDTIEDLSVVPRIKTKAGVQDSLKAAMKLRKSA